MPKTFVIMSFTDEYRRVYFESIKPAVEKAGCSCLRADEIVTPGNILSEIVQNIVNSDVVVADISESTPNVLYELGVSHAVGNKTITICRQDRIAGLPFDLKPLRMLAYTIDQMGLAFLKFNLQQSAEELLANKGNRPNNLVQEAARDFFDLRAKIEEALKRLLLERHRISAFADFLQKKRANQLQDNTDVADRIVWKIRDISPSPNHRVLVSICGAACAGKSTFSRLLAHRVRELLLGKINVSILPTDSYMSNRAYRIQEHLSGFNPASSDLTKLRNDVVTLLGGNSVRVAPYSHSTGEHESEIEIVPAEVLILEGILSLYPAVVPLSRRLRFFIYAEKEHLKELRFIADCLERGYDVQEAFRHSDEEYAEYEKYILPYLRIADEVILVDKYWKFRLPEPSPVSPTSD